MKKIKLQDMKKSGLFSEHQGCQIVAGPHQQVRLTIPAREALEASGATITPEPLDAEIGMPTYTVVLGDHIPAGLVAASTHLQCLEGHGYYEILSLRMEIEPPYPGEHDGDYWRRLDFTPCPKCGAPLIWYEAGYVPGYRVCAKKPHHHWLAGRGE
jgi:hypothetical protein